ncbi:hypothetical protein D1872_323230 [compost metagenome]
MEYVPIFSSGPITSSIFFLASSAFCLYRVMNSSASFCLPSNSPIVFTSSSGSIPSQPVVANVTTGAIFFSCSTFSAGK